MICCLCELRDHHLVGRFLPLEVHREVGDLPMLCWSFPGPLLDLDHALLLHLADIKFRGSWNIRYIWSWCCPSLLPVFGRHHLECLHLHIQRVGNKEWVHWCLLLLGHLWDGSCWSCCSLFIPSGILPVSIFLPVSLSLWRGQDGLPHNLEQLLPLLCRSSGLWGSSWRLESSWGLKFSSLLESTGWQEFSSRECLVNPSHHIGPS